MTDLQETVSALTSLKHEDGFVYAYEASFPVDLKVRRDGVLSRYDVVRTLLARRPSDGGMQLLVWKIGTTGIELFVNEPVTEVNRVYTSELDGTTYTTSPGLGCGCGNMLKSWSPSRATSISIARTARP